jgi:hypothetical protein
MNLIPLMMPQIGWQRRPRLFNLALLFAGNSPLNHAPSRI